MKPLRAALYHRVSTLDQDETLARDELQAAARARSCEVVESIEETGSGARNDRLGLQRVLDAARRGKLDVVIVYKLDRFGRSALDLLNNIEVLKSCGVRFIATTQGIDIKPEGDPMSSLLLTMLAAIAQFERDLIRERTRLGLQAARSKGKKLGRKFRAGGPTKDEVLCAKASGKSWQEVADQLGCSVSMARGRVYAAKWQGREAA